MTPSQEEWRPVVGYEGLYEVSDHGRVQSLDRTVRSRPGVTRINRGREMRQFVDDVGRRSVRLSRDGQPRTTRVSVIVLEAFVGPRPTGTFGCHNNGDPADNSRGNLRWDTPSENSRDTVRHGTNVEVRKTHCPRRHPLVEPNLSGSHTRRGKRTCLACHRALVKRRRAELSGKPFDMHQTADAEFDQIMQT